MGNRVHIVGLTADDALPSFWFALLREEHLGGSWEEQVRAAFADPDECVIEPLRLDWQEARTKLASARCLAETRLPGLAPALRAWEPFMVCFRQ